MASDGSTAEFQPALRLHRSSWLFALTGSLIGPIAAHALINGLNLLYLKSHDPEPQRRSLGGLLGQRS